MVSAFLSVFRQLICLVPIFWVLSRISLDLSWLAFVITECIVTAVGAALYIPQIRKWKQEEDKGAVTGP